MLLTLLLSACGSNDPNCLCDRGGDSVGTDDTATVTDDTATVTDTHPKVFDPETDLEWHVVEGTDGDCGTPWPLEFAAWTYDSKSKYKGHGESGVEPALGRSDVWDMELSVRVSWHIDTRIADSVWRIQCDGGRLLLLGVVSGSNEWVYDLIDEQSSYAASFETPIAIGLAHSTFDVAGQLWVADKYLPLPAEAVATTFSGTITNAGVDTISTPDGDVEATRLSLATNSQMFVDLFPKVLWLSESAGLVQFEGPIGDAPFVTAY